MGIFYIVINNLYFFFYSLILTSK